MRTGERRNFLSTNSFWNPEISGLNFPKERLKPISMLVDLDNSSTASGEASASSSGNQPPPPKSTATKTKRNLPGMPDPDAEVIALSPKTLLTTNRFVCEICNKGFQRDQNLQLHRRGHNLPWKLRQRSSKEVKKRVYVCPEVTCVHHDPSRALGDLTGIKKHFCRKHGEKKWKCDKCSKKYAVQSDWKAHSKICGTREYKCDCGTLFSRRDSFITHRAFCDALVEESTRAQTHSQSRNLQNQTAPVNPNPEPEAKVTQSPPLPSVPATATPATVPSPVSQSTDASSSVLQIQSPVPENPTQIVDEAPAPATATTTGLNGSCSSSTSSGNNGSASRIAFASLFASSTASGRHGSLLHPPQVPAFTDLMRSFGRPDHTPSSSAEPISLCLSTNPGSSIFGTSGQERRQYASPPRPAMSATALLQKAAQMGATASNASLLRGLGIVSASSSAAQQDILQWGQRQVDAENVTIAAGLGHGIPCDGSSGLKELMMGTPVFGPKQTTLDLLGLGRAAGGNPNGGFSALITSINGGLDVAAAAASYGGGEFAGKDIGRSS
ncbi:zinc finger protein GAI-ASSOCIATED FACTOR 1-like isoform X2 [Tripterygium wilfordii]|uniref:zinc finger protein GAI-ASSOCIATED FACTOR 1-like isoform X2 n=1 Tax=Tripterygium wilfordii TaxID=458696 RepID=UPI0018F84855|nr:zinc finger protein GAI-ASSOCIATED FACTOR 1-like isoform X2 [Tripterygium wilfordii]